MQACKYHVDNSMHSLLSRELLQDGKPPMEFSHIQTTKRYLQCKSFQKLMEKLFLHYNTGKINKNEMLVKLSKLRSLVKTLSSDLKAHTNIIHSRDGLDAQNFFILEHLNYNFMFRTSAAFEKKHNLAAVSDTQFFREIKDMQEEIANGDCNRALSYCRENKVHLKEMFSKLETKLRIIEFVKICGRDKSRAMEYAREFFKKERESVRHHLISLIEREEHIDAKKIACDFASSVYKLYNINDRLSKRLEFGTIAFKTSLCADRKSLECPGCTFSKYTRMTNRVENSEIVCEGSHIVLDSSNQAFADETGKVYGRKYIIESGITLKDPKICYFV